MLVVDTVSAKWYNQVADTVSTKINRRFNTMFKGTPEIITQRREEIVNACEQLYQTTSFKDITLKEIGNVTSFSRPTIYNYFHTKEEIFLALFKREYDRWNAELESILESNQKLSRDQLAEKIAGSLKKRSQLLKLLSMNNYDMEQNSREELLASFKTAYGKSLKLFREILEKNCPKKSGEEITEIIYVFFPFMFGIYPYTAVTEKQRVAMQEAGINYVYQTVYELTYSCLIRLLGE